MPFFEIKDDRQTPLDVIRRRGNGSISSALVEIQKYRVYTKDEWVDYVENLPCVVRPAPREAESKRRRTNSGHIARASRPVLKRASINAFERRDYAAVSYRWDESKWEDGNTGGYRCIPVGAQRLEDCRVRDQVIDRVTNFLHSVGCELFWIDQICLNQFDPAEKQIGMRSMHAVYRRSNFPVAIISTPIQTEEDMELLYGLLDGSRLNDYFETNAAAKVLALIKRLTDDAWWQSAWTFEEDYCAAKMTMLIPHSPSLNSLKDRGDMENLFGDLDNELCVSSMRFRNQVNKFCKMYKEVYPSRFRDNIDCEHLLRAAPKYKTLLRDANNETRVSMSPYILADLAHRRIRYVPDSTTVASNCCDYTIGIEVDAMHHKWSPSLVMLTQYILNGEILCNHPSTRCFLNNSVFEYLKNQSLKTHQPPIERNALTFIKSSRLSVLKLTEHGTMVRGHLWKLSKIFEVPIYNSSNGVERSSARGLNSYQRQRLKDLAVAIQGQAFGNRYQKLANGIWAYLREDKRPRRGTSSWKEYMDIMAEELVEALRTKKPLRLGRLVDKNDKHSSYLAIFIWDIDAENDETHVFTSFEEGHRCWKDVQKHVSIGVDVDKRTRNLYTRTWRNGIIFTPEEFFTREERTSTFLFPWPPALKRE